MMQRARSTDPASDAGRPVDRHRETARQHPARRRICNSTGIRPLPITGTQAQRPLNRKSCPTRRGVCSTLHTLNCFNQNAKDAPIRIGASFQRGFAFGITRAEHLVGMHSESPGSNALSACFRVCRVRTQCQQASGIARAERHAGMHSHLPEPNGTPASQARPPSPQSYALANGLGTAYTRAAFSRSRS